jgi:TetR/AcrR family transcriptional regulator
MTPDDAATGTAQQIIDAATELFSRSGFEGMSVATIAAQAGVSKANVFHHFASKEGLYVAVMQAMSREHAELVEPIINEPGCVADKVRKLFRAELALMFQTESRSRLVLAAIESKTSKDAQRLAQQVFHRNFVATVALFESGQRSGEFRSDFDPAVATLTLIATRNLYFRSHELLALGVETQHLQDRNCFADRVCDLVLRGLLAAPSLGAMTISVAPSDA